jgi:hypothetical protein
MSAIAIKHIKVWQRDGGLTLEPCEDDGCSVDAAGHASCGRAACPECGCGGANLSAGPGKSLFCTCGYFSSAAA